MRTNAFNDGRSFQKEIELTLSGYENRGMARMAKVDPPVRIFGGGGSRKVLFTANPWLDYAGVWTAQYGRAIFVEAKSTSSDRLPINRHGGLTESQWTAMRAWRRAGAACALLWKFDRRVALFVPEMLDEAIRAGEISVRFDEGRAVENGQGKVLWDFLSTLSDVLWPGQKKVENVVA